MVTAIPYDPSLRLEDNYPPVYKIYSLINPDTNEVFYIGQTSAELKYRLLGHLSKTDKNKQKAEYIQTIMLQGKRPIIKELETINVLCYADKCFVNERELYWMKHYKSNGSTLFNIFGSSSDSICKEYHMYMTCIKSGEMNPRYYYCGKTTDGIPVYNVEKLTKDGFKFEIKQPDPPKRMTADEIMEYLERKREEERYEYYRGIKYNPWNNPRFIKMIDYRRIDSNLSYVPCYKDLDPKYYDDDY